MAHRMINLDAYPRRAHFEHFLTQAYPYVGVTVHVDVTELVRLCKAQGISFYLAFIHAAALAADGVPELRRRIREGGIAEYERCPTSHTEPLPDGTYCYCTLHHHMPFDQYIRYAEKTRKQYRQRGTIQEDAEVESMYFISCLPWLHYTALLQPTAGGNDANPRITWGKYEPDARGRLMLPVSVLAHHALVDGLHLARFYEELSRTLDAIVNGPHTL